MSLSNASRSWTWTPRYHPRQVLFAYFSQPDARFEPHSLSNGPWCNCDISGYMTLGCSVMALCDLFWLFNNKPLHDAFLYSSLHTYKSAHLSPADCSTRDWECQFPLSSFLERCRYGAASSAAKKVWTTALWKYTHPGYLLSFPLSGVLCFRPQV